MWARAPGRGRDKPDQLNSHLLHLCAFTCVCVCVCMYVRACMCMLQVRERIILSRKGQRIANINGMCRGRQTISSSLPPESPPLPRSEIQSRPIFFDFFLSLSFCSPLGTLDRWSISLPAATYQAL